MRIVAGEFKGRVIDSPSEKTTRPTTDRVRESMFSAIFSQLGTFEGITVLDAFAGSGALGLEALSRGAKSCLFFERDRQARQVLDANIASLGLSRTRARVQGTDVFGATKRPLGAQGPFDLVLLDPPYALEAADVAELIERLASNGDLASGALIVYEHACANAGKGKGGKKAAAPEGLSFGEGASIEVLQTKRYGKIGVTFMMHA